MLRSPVCVEFHESGVCRAMVIVNCNLEWCRLNNQVFLIKFIILVGNNGVYRTLRFVYAVNSLFSKLTRCFSFFSLIFCRICVKKIWKYVYMYFLDVFVFLFRKYIMKLIRNNRRILVEISCFITKGKILKENISFHLHTKCNLCDVIFNMWDSYVF